MIESQKISEFQDISIQKRLYIKDYTNSISLYKDIVFIRVIGKGKTIAIKSRSELSNKQLFL